MDAVTDHPASQREGPTIRPSPGAVAIWTRSAAAPRGGLDKHSTFVGTFHRLRGAGRKEIDMKFLIAVAIVGALALSPTAFAQSTPSTKAECLKAKMKW